MDMSMWMHCVQMQLVFPMSVENKKILLGNVDGAGMQIWMVVMQMVG